MVVQARETVVQENQFLGLFDKFVPVSDSNKESMCIEPEITTIEKPSQVVGAEAISSGDGGVAEALSSQLISESEIAPVVVVSVTKKKVVYSSGGIGKPGRILSETRIVDGKKACAKKNDHPVKSNNNPKGHIDGECCLDPDEIPNSLCYYPPEKYGKLIQGYLDSLKYK